MKALLKLISFCTSSGPSFCDAAICTGLLTSVLEVMDIGDGVGWQEEVSWWWLQGERTDLVSLKAV